MASSTAKKYTNVSANPTLLTGLVWSSIFAVAIFATTTLFLSPVTGILVAAAFGLGFFGLGLVITKVGFQSSIKRFGTRLNKVFEEGYGWIFPVIFTRDEIDARDRKEVVKKDDYLTKDTVPVSADTETVWGINNVAASQSYQGDLGELVGVLTEEAVRRYILQNNAMAANLFKPIGQMTNEEKQELKRAVSAFKTDLSENGRGYVRDEVNLGLAEYECEVRRIVIENVRFPKEIEDAGGEELREQLESRGDTTDWNNTNDLVKSSIDAMIDRGFKYDELTAQQQRELEQELRDQVLAKKKQATRISSTGGNGLLNAAALLKGGDR